MDTKEKTVIYGNTFYDMILNKQINGQTLENIKINCNSTHSVNTFENITFENVTFKNVDFIAAIYNHCLFTKCSFIDCLFFDTEIVNNNFVECHFNDVNITNNSSLVQNRFEQVTGNINSFTAQGQENNYFINMNFDGFTSLYTSVRKSGVKIISTRRNFFKNTTISLSTLDSLSKTVDWLVGAYRDFNNTYLRIIDCNTSNDNIIDVSNRYGTLDYYNGIDLKNMSHESKLNLIASVFTKYHLGECYNIVSGCGNSFESKQLLNHYTIDNPLPIIIVNDKECVFDGVIEDINYRVNNPLLYYEFCLTPGEQIIDYNHSNSLLNSNNYSCKKNIKTANKP